MHPMISPEGDVDVVPQEFTDATIKAMEQIDPSLFIRRNDLVVEGSLEKYKEL